MEQTKQLYSAMKALCVYDFGQDPVWAALSALLMHAQDEDASAYWAEFYKTLTKADEAGDLKQYIAALILTNDNRFTRLAAGGSELPAHMIDAVEKDLKKLEQLAGLTPECLLTMIENEKSKPLLQALARWEANNGISPLTEHWPAALPALMAYHKQNGYGQFARYKAFAWRERRLFPVTSSNPITLNDLKSYEKQRQKVVENTESFVMGLPANNVLLYGDRGTGKSSTVHAVLNAFAPKGLRMIEVPKSAIPEFPLLLEQLVDAPLKFILFIDDLSFSSDDDSYASLKAALEGSVSARQSNALIYATSNRRHLIKESFAAREGDELHRTDTIQETMSLSDRFGLSVTFLNPDRERFYQILEQIAADRGLALEQPRLRAGAERWALERGGRSPRAAKQYMDWVESRVKRGLNW